MRVLSAVFVASAIVGAWLGVPASAQQPAGKAPAAKAPAAASKVVVYKSPT